jgi:hypothetical protein
MADGLLSPSAGEFSAVEAARSLLAGAKSQLSRSRSDNLGNKIPSDHSVKTTGELSLLEELN